MTQPENTRILLSGASGMLGSTLGQELATRGFEVLRLVRRPPAAPNEIYWNPEAVRPVEEPGQLEGFRAVVHLSGANLAARRWTAAYKRELLRSRVESTQALATLLAGLERPPAALLTGSAVGIYGDRGNELLDEGSVPGEGFLAGLCQQWEAAAQPAREAGIRVVSLRTGVALASGEGAMARLLPLFRLGAGGRLGSGRQWMSWIARLDWVRAAIFLIERGDLAGDFNLTAPEPATNAEFTRTLARVLRRPAIMPAPALALRMALGEMAQETLLASQRALPKRLLEAGFAFEQPGLEQALRAVVAGS